MNKLLQGITFILLFFYLLDINSKFVSKSKKYPPPVNHNAYISWLHYKHVTMFTI